jgi:cytochrome c-type biogenesis protein CcmH/NrfG
MDLPNFHPPASSIDDKSSDLLRTWSQYILVAVCGFLPILFFPSALLPVSTSKILIVAIAVALSLVLLMLSVLKTGSLTIRYPLILVSLWGIAAVALVSAVLSGDLRDSLFGDGLDSQTAWFAFLMALMATLSASLASNRQAIIRLYALLVFSALLVSIFHIVRILFGADALSFGVFTNAVSSPLGNWNGLAIFYGLVVLLVLTSLETLPFSKAGRFIAIGVVVLAMIMLAIVNFTPAWWVLAIVSGVLCLYRVAFGWWSGKANGRGEGESLHLTLVKVAVLLVSVSFLVVGGFLGSNISEKTGIANVEVRPSLLATVEMAEAVYADNLLLGVGPNRFVDVWRVHKDPVINETVFWNTPFASGFSYVFTSILGTGLAGTIAYLIFFGSLLWTGVKFLLYSKSSDRTFHFIGTSSLVASLYFWLMALVYVPPASILLLGAVTTGVFVASYVHMRPGRGLMISAEQGRIYGVALVVIAVTITSGVLYATYAAANEVAAAYKFNRAVTTATGEEQSDDLDSEIAESLSLSRNDVFAAVIASRQLVQMSNLIATPNAGPSEQEQFQLATTRAIESARMAITLDPTNPYNHQLLGRIYSILARVGVEGAADRARESFAASSQFDPQNPFLDLLNADLSLGQTDIAGARAHAEDAVRKKPNYTEALFFLAQLDINDGNVTRAIDIVSAVVGMEPSNPARRYQLGVLLASAERIDEAAAAFETAVRLDPQYANARYFLALAYVEQDKIEEAIAQLDIVRQLNADNTAVNGMIEELRSSGTLTRPTAANETVPERDPEQGTVVESDLDNGLVTSPNPVPESGQTETVDSDSTE